MPEDDPAEDPEGESDDSVNTPEGTPTGEGDDELDAEEPADETDPGEEAPEEDLSLEEIADEALQDVPEDPGEESPSAEEEDDDLSPEELADEVLGEEDPAPEEDPGEEPTPEELAGEVLDESDETEDDDSSVEDRPDADPEEEEPEEDVPSEEPFDEGSESAQVPDDEPGGEEEDPPGQDVGDDEPAGEDPDEAQQQDQAEQEPPEDHSEEESAPPQRDREEAGTAAGSSTDEDDSSIQSMLEEEAERARDEEEEELPEGYLTVEQLPEEEEFEVPGWLVVGGWYSLYALIGFLTLWSLLLPLWETFLTNQIRSSMNRGQAEVASGWADWGTGVHAYLIKNDDAFRADYLKQLLEAKELEAFRKEYDALSGIDPSPFMDQVHAQYLLNRERWSEALRESERLQRWVRTRGQGYLIHGKAALELGQYEQTTVDATRATQWLGEHPGPKRLLRDLNYRQGNYREALKLANQVQDLTDEDRWTMKVDDYVQMARINKKLERHRVAQRMLERALDRDPRNQGALKDLGEQYLLEERWERAEPLIEGSSDRLGYRSLFPLSAFGWWGGSELARNDGDTARSIRLIERAEDIDPRNAEVHRIKGRLYHYELDQPAQAVQEYERARELGIRRLRFINELAQARYQTGQYEGAVEAYSTLRSKLGDTLPQLNYNLGSALLGAGEYTRAEELISRVFEKGYRNQDSYNQWGLLLELRGERQKALAKYVEGIEWAERNNEPIERVRDNLNRALAQEPPTPRVEWLAPVQGDLGIHPWQTLDNTGKSGSNGDFPSS